MEVLPSISAITPGLTSHQGVVGMIMFSWWAYQLKALMLLCLRDEKSFSTFSLIAYGMAIVVFIVF